MLSLMSADIEIRRADITEIETLSAIDIDACVLFERAGLNVDFGKDHEFAIAERSRWLRCLAANATLLAIDHSGEPVGFAARAVVDGDGYVEQLSVRTGAMRRGIGAALLRAMGGGSARGPVDRRRARIRGMSRAAPGRRRPTTYEVPGIQACTTCRDGGLGVRRPDTQAHDDMPPAACRAWRARSSHTEPGLGRTGASLPHRPWPTRSP